MAAPSIPKHKKDACLQKLVAKEKTVQKLSKKNILCPESQEWPRPSADVADQILSKLSEILEHLPNLFKCEKNTPLEAKENKGRVRSQLDIGVATVFRALEKDRLAGVLVSGQAQPAAIVDHVISLARERGCPLLCLDSLSTTLAAVTKTKVLPLCVGFKVPASDFAPVVELIRDNTKVRNRPAEDKTMAMSVEGTRLEELPASLSSASLRPFSVDAGSEQEMMNEMKGILSKFLETEVEPKKSKKRKKKPKANLKDLFHNSLHCHFEIGKRTVMDILERGKLELILVTSEIVPFLVMEAPALSLLGRAGHHGCSIVAIPGLTTALRAACGGNISVLAFKKLSCLPPGTTPVFNSVIDKCRHILQTASSSASQEANTLKNGDESKSASESRQEKVKKSRGTEKEMDEDMGEDEEDDYSYLHIMKNDSAQYKESVVQMKQDLETYGKEESLSGNFISLVSTSTVTSSKLNSATSRPEKEEKRKRVAEEDGAVSKQNIKKKKRDNDLPSGKDDITTISRLGSCQEESDLSNKQAVEVEDDGRSRPLKTQSVRSKDDGFLSFSTNNEAHSCASVDEESTELQMAAQRSEEEATLPIVKEGEPAMQLMSIDESEAQGTYFVDVGKRKENTIVSEDMSAAPPTSASTFSTTTDSSHDDTVSSSLFTISRKGDPSSKGASGGGLGPKAVLGKSVAASIPTASSWRPLASGQILGGDRLLAAESSKVKADSEHIKHVFEATSSQGKRKKKRKGDVSSDQGFISLGYNEANIHTMVSDFSKKKKKKKKK